MAIIGAILGDIIGSVYEFEEPEDSSSCELFPTGAEFTDDTVMTLAIKKAVIKGKDYDKMMRQLGNLYPDCGYGAHFMKWLHSDNPQPYKSCGNGSAMRVSYIGEHFETMDEVHRQARATALPTHNHPEGIRGAVTEAICVWMAKGGASKQEIYDYVLERYPAEKYPYAISHSMEEFKDIYTWDPLCQGSIPFAMRCFYESEDFESFMRNVLSVNCDADTIGAIGGAVAWEFYHGSGFDEEAILKKYLDDTLLELVYA